jgi:Mg2+-importing ATPase
MNLLTDFPEMTIATDNVDNEMIDYPRRWDIKVIRKFMITFGLVSSVFDYLTFGVLLLVLHASQIQFRTGWFLESVVSAAVIVLVIRSRKPFFKSRPGQYLLATTLAIICLTLILPFTPLAGIFGFSPLPLSFLLLIGVVIFGYIITAELVKHIFYKYVKL